MSQTYEPPVSLLSFFSDRGVERYSLGHNPDRLDPYIYLLFADITPVAKFSDVAHAARCMWALDHGYPLAELEGLLGQEQHALAQLADLTYEED